MKAELREERLRWIGSTESVVERSFQARCQVENSHWLRALLVLFHKVSFEPVARFSRKDVQSIHLLFQKKFKAGQSHLSIHKGQMMKI